MKPNLPFPFPFLPRFLLLGALLPAPACTGGDGPQPCPGGPACSSTTSGTTTGTSTSTSSTSTFTPGTGCKASSVNGIHVAPSDPGGGTPFALGYPPYSISDCRLAYVAAPPAGSTAGDLILKDLLTGDEKTLDIAANKPYRPSLSGDVIAWEAQVYGKRVVKVSFHGTTSVVFGAFDHAGEPHAGADGVVFTGFLTAQDLGDTDVFFTDGAGGEAMSVASGPGQQRFADVSPTHIAFTDFSEDPDGTFNDDGQDLADIGVIDRSTKAHQTRALPGKQAFPLLGVAGKIAYLGWGPDHPEPKFSAYQLLVGDITAGPAADAVAVDIMTTLPYVRPTAVDTRLEWIQWPGGQASLWRRPADLSSPAAAVPGVTSTQLFGPSASPDLTVVASTGPQGGLVLLAAEK